MHTPLLSSRSMSHKMVVVNEWTDVVRTPTGRPMIISSSLTGWPIGFLISAGNPTLPIFTVPSFTGWPMGLLVCALLAGPSYQVPPSPAGQWLLGLCFVFWHWILPPFWSTGLSTTSFIILSTHCCRAVEMSVTSWKQSSSDMVLKRLKVAREDFPSHT